MVSSNTNFPQLIKDDFVKHDPLYVLKQKWGRWRVERRRQKLTKLEVKNGQMSCSAQLCTEAKWLVGDTDDFNKLDNQLTQIDDSFKENNQPDPNAQDPKDGSFGLCYKEWFHKLDQMIVATTNMYDEGTTPEYPFTFMDFIGTPNKMLKVFTPLITSNIVKTGMNNRDAIGAATGAMSQLVYKDYMREWARKNINGFDLTPEYCAAYDKFINEWQNPDTGFWGEWYESDGKLYKSDDLSFTYHTISYRRGKVDMWNEIIETLFAMKNKEYPFGWKWDGHFNNHNSYDVVKIMKYGWKEMTKTQQARASIDIQEMLDWCLNVSLLPDGSFKPYPKFYNSYGATFYYGVAFLNKVGYFDEGPPFWRLEPFPEGKTTCKKILAKLTELGLDDNAAQSAKEILEDACGCTPPSATVLYKDHKNAREELAQAHIKKARQVR